MRRYELLLVLVSMKMCETARGTEVVRDPFLVEINIDEGSGRSEEPRSILKSCTGIILKSKLVLSACHCFTDDGEIYYEPWRAEVVAGVQKIKGRKIIPHPDCRKTSVDVYDNDMAVLILQSHLSLIAGVHNILVPVQTGSSLYAFQTLIQASAICYVRGLEPGGSRSKKMVVTKVKLMDSDKCREVICRLDKSDSYWCKKHSYFGYTCAQADVETCLGHSGAGLFCKGILYGIDAVSYPCNSTERPLIFTNVEVYKELINDFNADGENLKLLEGKGPAIKSKVGHNELKPVESEVTRDPFLVEINIDVGSRADNKPSANVKTCTGIIIKSKVVLSACHCFTDDGERFYEPWRVKIIAHHTGNHWDKRQMTQRIKGRKIIPHPECELQFASTFDNDLAFVILQSHLDLLVGDRNVAMPARVGSSLQRLRELIKEEAECYVRGLEPGIAGCPDDRPKKMEITKVTLIDSETCRKLVCKLAGRDTNEGKYWCAKGSYYGYSCGLANVTKCSTRSGAGLFCNGFLYGVDTVPFSVLGNSTPLIFTNIQAYKELLKDFKADDENLELSEWGVVPPKRKPNVTSISRDPSLVEIYIDKGGSVEKPMTTCTGFILKSKIVVSTCHCITPDGGKSFYEKERVEIIAGTGRSWDKPPISQKIKVEEIFPHPDCKNDISDNDLAFIILQSPLRFFDHNARSIVPVELGTNQQALEILAQDMAVCYVRGLQTGVLHPQDPPKKMMEYKLTLMDKEACRELLCKLDTPDSYWCTKGTYVGYTCGLTEVKTCLGHSGAGLFCKGMLYGVDTVDKTPCKSAQWPLIFSNIQIFHELLEEFTKNGHYRQLWAEPNRIHRG